MTIVSLVCIQMYSQIEPRGGMEGLGQGIVLALGAITVRLFFGLFLLVLLLRSCNQDRPIYFPIGAIVIIAIIIGGLLSLRLLHSEIVEQEGASQLATDADTR